MGEAARKKKAGLVIEPKEVIITCYSGRITGISFVVTNAVTEERLYQTAYVHSLKDKVVRMKWKVKDVIQKTGV